MRVRLADTVFRCCAYRTARNDGVDVILTLRTLACTHVVIRDAFASAAIPIVEAHRLTMRQSAACWRYSCLSDSAQTVLGGVGMQGMRTGLFFIVARRGDRPAGP